MTRLKRKKLLAGSHPDDIRFGTPPEVSTHRAKRLACDTLIEIGCGAGFQTLEFAKTCGQVYAIDMDNEKMGRAKALCKDLSNITWLCGNALDPNILEKIKVHRRVIIFCDPTRPPNATTRQLKDLQPNPNDLASAYSKITQEIAIELPPFLSQMPWSGEKEFISLHHALNRLTLYGGKLANNESTAVLLPSGLTFASAQPSTLPRSVTKPRFLGIPDPAIIRADLLEVAAHGLSYSKEICGKKQIITTEYLPSPNALQFAWYRIEETWPIKSLMTAIARQYSPLRIHGATLAYEARKGSPKDLFVTHKFAYLAKKI